MLRVIHTGVAAAEENMNKDAALLKQLDSASDPILHFYDWDGPSATCGYFIQPSKYFHLEKASARRLQIAKRPTGGGIVFHLWDFAFSFLMPANHKAFSQNTLHNYQFVNQAVLDAVSDIFSLNEAVSLIADNYPSFHFACDDFCMAKPTRYDVVYQGKKIAGASQRRTNKGYLHQGTISLAAPDFSFLQDVLLSDATVFEAMANYTFSPLGAHWDSRLLKETRQNIQHKLQKKLAEQLH